MVHLEHTHKPSQTCLPGERQTLTDNIRSQYTITLYIQYLSRDIQELCIRVKGQHQSGWGHISSNCRARFTEVRGQIYTQCSIADPVCVCVCVCVCVSVCVCVCV